MYAHLTNYVIDQLKQTAHCLADIKHPCQFREITEHVCYYASFTVFNTERVNTLVVPGLFVLGATVSQNDAKDIYSQPTKPCKRPRQRQNHIFADVGPPVLPARGYKPNHKEPQQRSGDEQPHVVEAMAVLWNIPVIFDNF